MRIIVKDIQWEKDGATVDLPATMELVGVGAGLDDPDSLQEMIGDEISNVTGFLHHGFSFTVET